MAVAELGASSTRASRIAADATRPASNRIADLRALKPADTAEAGQIAMYIGGLELQREGEALDRFREGLIAAENADVRDEMIARGVATPDELDSAGFLSADELDARREDGTLAEGFFGSRVDPAKLAAIARRRRRNHGEFADELSPLNGPPKPKGRGGAAIAGSSSLERHAQRLASPTPQMPPPAASPGTDPVALALAEVREYGLNDWPKKGEVATKILGKAKDTQELHTRPLAASPGTTGAKPKRAYTAERKVTHDKIIGGMLHDAVAKVVGADHPVAQKLAAGGTLSDDDKQQVRDAAQAARGGARPKALFMAGGPASGKTSALKQSPELEPDASVLINPDDIKEALPEYDQMVEGGEKYAANGVHEESSDLGKRLQSEAMDLGLNVVVDGTGDSKKGKFAGKMKDLDGAGYDISALYVTCPTDEAVVRATKRARETGRWVPEPEIRAQHKNVSANFPDIAALPFLKDLKVYDTSGEGGPELIGEGAGGEFKDHSPEAMDTFLAKTHEADYVPDASEGTRDNPIKVGGDVNLAAQHLAQGHHVQLDQPAQVSTLLDHLHKQTQDFEAKGEKAPLFDLCKVSVPGTNLFCADTKGYSRVEMPQLKGIPEPGSKADALPRTKKGNVDLGPAFADYLEGMGAKVTKEKAPASHLRATQRQLDGSKVAGMMSAFRSGEKKLKKHDRLFISKDNYIVDGHHRWAAQVGLDSRDGRLGDIPMDVHRVDLPITEILRHAHEFSKDQGVGVQGVQDHLKD